jgi:hypothetical protein
MSVYHNVSRSTSEATEEIFNMSNQEEFYYLGGRSQKKYIYNLHIDTHRPTSFMKYQFLVTSSFYGHLVLRQSLHFLHLYHLSSS